MTEEALKQIEENLMKPIREIQDMDRKRITDLQSAMNGLPDLGETLKRIEDKLDQILGKLK